MVNHGDEKVSVHMNVMPRSTLIYTSELRRNPIENRAISGFSGQKSVPE